MIKQLLFLLSFCGISFAMNKQWVPIIKGTINNNTDKPISVEIIVDDTDNKLTPRTTAKLLTAIVEACCQKNFEIEIERK